MYLYTRALSPGHPAGVYVWTQLEIGWPVAQSLGLEDFFFLFLFQIVLSQVFIFKVYLVL